MSTVNVFSGSIISKANPNLEFQTETNLGDNQTVLTAAQVIGGMFVATPTASRTQTLPTAALLVAAIPGIAVGSTIDFSIQNQGAVAVLETLILPASITSTLNGAQLIVPGFFTGGGAASSSGCATFRLRCTNITAAAEAFVLYRIS